MYVEFDDAGVFKKIIEALTNLIDEGTFRVSKDGLTVRSMDPSQISMVDLFIPKTAFLKYDVAEDKTFSINLQDLLKILSRAKGKLALDLSEENSKLFIELQGDTKKSFKLPLLDLQQQMPREPAIQFEAAMRMRADTFKDTIKDAGVFASHIVMEATKDGLFVEAQGDSGEMKTETKKDSKAFDKFEASGSKARAMFPYDYLEKLSKSATEEYLELNLKTNAPIKLEYNIGKAKLKYYLAPRVEN